MDTITREEQRSVDALVKHVEAAEERGAARERERIAAALRLRADVYHDLAYDIESGDL